MSAFGVPIVHVTVLPHPQADRLEIGLVAGYQTIVPKGQFRTGDLAAYLPEESVVPDALLDELGLRGKLAGPNANRIRAQKFRGILSQGLLYPARPHWRLGDDVQEELGIVRYIPPIPPHFAGDVYNPGRDVLLEYDIPNYQQHPDLVMTGELVVITEKLHGTCLQLSVVPKAEADPRHLLKRILVTSKGLANTGLAFYDVPRNAENVYMRAAKRPELLEALIRYSDDCQLTVPLILLGEVIGHHIQDLPYGYRAGAIDVRFFDAYLGTRFKGRYMNDEELDQLCQTIGVFRVPIVWRGPFSHVVAHGLAQGQETVSGRQLHCREGIVIRPQVERIDPLRGRAIVKWKSEAYLLRHHGTEYS